MRRSFLFGLLLLVFLATGCATARVWQNVKSETPSSESDVRAALKKCEQTLEVAKFHKNAKLYSDAATITLVTVVFMPVAVPLAFAGDALAGKYVDYLTKCMHENDYYNMDKRSGRLQWNGLSNFDISVERWNREHPEDMAVLFARTAPPPEILKIPDAPKTPEAPNTTDTPKPPAVWKIVIDDAACLRSGPGEDYPVITNVRKGDRLTIIERAEGESGEWRNVRIESGEEGWVHRRFVEERP